MLLLVVCNSKLSLVHEQELQITVPASLGRVLQLPWPFFWMYCCSFSSSSGVHGPFLRPLSSQQGDLPMGNNCQAQVQVARSTTPNWMMLMSSSAPWSSSGHRAACLYTGCRRLRPLSPSCVVCVSCYVHHGFAVAVLRCGCVWRLKKRERDLSVYARKRVVFR